MYAFGESFKMYFLSQEYKQLSKEIKKLKDLLSQHGIAYKGNSGEFFGIICFHYCLFRM